MKSVVVKADCHSIKHNYYDKKGEGGREGILYTCTCIWDHCVTNTHTNSRPLNGY